LLSYQAEAAASAPNETKDHELSLHDFHDINKRIKEAKGR